MTLDWKLCKKCGEFFDVGINLDICPKCRKKDLDEKGEKNGRKNY